MEGASIIEGSGVPVRGADVDTDRIIPARYLKTVTFDGLGAHAFQDERFDPAGRSKGHPFDDERHRGASILLVNANFGCGSSREHAPQALYRYGIRAIVGESFAEIFAGNCLMMGLPAVTTPSVGQLQDLVDREPGASIRVDLATRTVAGADIAHEIEIPESARQSLLAGTWDSTAMLRANDAEISATVERIPYLSWQV